MDFSESPVFMQESVSEGVVDHRLTGQALVYRHEPTLFAMAATIAGLLWLLIIFGTLGIALAYLLVFYIVYLFAHSAFIAHLKGHAVRISPTQFPDLFGRLLESASILKMEVPEAYILHGNGIFNAFATRFLGRNFLVLLSDVVDALEERPDAINFYIGHELGHIRRQHMFWGPVLAPASIMPLLGAAYSRAREYTCDLHGLACCQDRESALRGIAALAAGHSRWKTLDLQAYQEQVRETGGFWMSFHELTGDYPYLTKRLQRIHAAPAAVSFPHRSVWAWVLAIFSPRMGLGAAAPLLAVAMIGVLAAIAVPAYQSYMARVNVSQAYQAAQAASAAVTTYYTANQNVPDSLTAAGITVPPPNSGYILELGTSGEVLVRLKDKPVMGRAIELEPRLDRARKVNWHCQTNIPQQYLPKGLVCESVGQQ